MSEVQLGTTSRRIIRGPKVESRVGKSRVSIWRDVKAGTFPAPVQIGPNSIGWYEDEIDARGESGTREPGSVSGAKAGDVP
jgi:prophage regulatory protein